MRRSALLVVVLVVLAGCAGPVADSPAGDRSTTTDRARTDKPDKPNKPDKPDQRDPTTTAPTDGTTATATAPAPETAGERAIAAEKSRIRDVTADWTGLADLRFGAVRPVEYEVHSRNASGTVVDVTVGYSTSFDCGLSLGGRTTETRYLVTTDTTRLVGVERNATQPPGGYC